MEEDALEDLSWRILENCRGSHRSSKIIEDILADHSENPWESSRIADDIEDHQGFLGDFYRPEELLVILETPPRMNVGVQSFSKAFHDSPRTLLRIIPKQTRKSKILLNHWKSFWNIQGSPMIYLPISDLLQIFNKLWGWTGSTIVEKAYVMSTQYTLNISIIHIEIESKSNQNRNLRSS